MASGDQHLAQTAPRRGTHRSRTPWSAPDELCDAAGWKVALEAPLKQIAVNAGLEGDVVAETVRSLTAGEGQPEISHPSRLRAFKRS
jgi:hypothetical protein